MTHGVDDRSRVDLDLPRSHVVGDEGEAFVDHGVKVDRLLVQLTTAEHRPMAIDDLRGEDALAWMSARISPIASGVARLAVTIIWSAWALYIIAAERLPELMSNRSWSAPTSSRGDWRRRRAPGSCRLSISARCRARRSYRSPTIRSDWRTSAPTAAQHHAACIRPTGSGGDTARRCPAATGSRGCPIAAARANRISVDPAVAAAL